MPAFTVSSTDTTANTLTATGVGAVGAPVGSKLLTGDRFRLRNVGGALPAATPSLAPVTDYFARRLSDDAIQVYDTNAHALAGGSTGLVDITGAGSGTTTIEFNLPYCVPRIAAPLTQAFSQDDNAQWNSLVSLYDLLTGQTQNIFSGVTLAANQDVTISGTGRFKHGVLELGVPTAPGNYNAGAAGVPGASLGVPAISGSAGSSGYAAFFSLPVGKRIVNAKAVIQESTSGATDKAQVSLFRNPSTTGAGSLAWTLVGTGAASSGNGSAQTILLNANHTVLTLNSYALVVNFALGSAPITIYRTFVEYDT